MSTTSAIPSLASSIGGTTGTGTTAGAGLGQGINVQQFVQYAVANQQAAITALQTQETTLGSQAGEISTIVSQLNGLGDAAFALSNPLGALAAQSATSSAPSVVNATAASTAVAGNHTITVSNLATTSSYYTKNELPSSTSTISSGSFQLQVGSNAPVTVTVDSNNNTLSQLTSSINDQNLGVAASVIQDANGYRLALVSNSSGSAGDVTISNDTTGLNFTKAVTGTNANLTVDGVPISSASNTVSNALNGVTLNLGATTGSTPVVVNVSPDTSQATTAINNFVSAYNTVVTEVNNQFNVASDGSGGGVLESDNTLREVQSQLLGAISYSIGGNNGVVNLASIGVNLNNDGTLSVDSNALNTALSSNYGAVQNLLQNATTGFTQNLHSVISNLTGPANGLLTLDSQSITSTAQGLTKQISDLQAALVLQEQNLTAVYSQVNATLQELPLLQSQVSQQFAALG